MRHALAYIDSRGRKRLDLLRIVGHQTDGIEADHRQHARGDAVQPLVAFEAEPLVRLDGVESLILQAIGAEFVDEADAAALLGEIKQDAAAGSRNRGQRFAKLRAAIATQRSQKVARETLRMEARENRTAARRIADDDREMLRFTRAGAKRDN